jgi:CRISPR-associated protein Cmr6
MNLHKLYYKDYFKDIDFGYLLQKENKTSDKAIQKIEEKNADIQKATLHTIEKPALSNKGFQLKVSYPGLVTGIGISHETGIEGEFKLGVHFDYTYGMPIVYGSSVKGILKNAFSDSEYILSLLPKINVEDLMKDIFEGKEKNKEKSEGDPREYINKSIYNRDIFFDAVIVKGNSKGKVLASDSITPHGDDLLKNPIPITFLKIASGVTMEFRFKLVSSKINGIDVTSEDKERLFKQILLDFGVGAKTNVGYGQFKIRNREDEINLKNL